MSASPNDFEQFVQNAIGRFWRSDAATRLDLIALLLASREAWKVALDSASANKSSLLKGAAGVAGVTVILRSVLGGPLGLLLAGVSVGSLGALYAKHHERIWTQVERYKALVDEYRPKFAAVTDEQSGAISDEQRDLMIEGLQARFVRRLEDLPHMADDDE